MEGDIINLIRNISLESLCFGVLVFGLTMVIKYPIKKFTNKLIEEKRKAVNTIILLIPIVLLFIVSVLYYGLVKSMWINYYIVIECAISSWIISISIYTIYERISILIKGLKSGVTKINSELTKDTLKFLKSNIKNLTAQIKIDEKQKEKTQKKLTSLVEIKEIFEAKIKDNNFSNIYETNIEIEKLKNEEINLQNKIDENNAQIQSYKETLYEKKGEKNVIQG